MRGSIAEHAGPAMRLEMGQFLEHALPQSLTKEQVQSVIDRTRTRVMHLIATGRRDRRASGEHFFQHIESIIEEVSSAGSEVLGINPVGRVSYRPRDQPESSERNNTTKPDCNILLNKLDSPLGSYLTNKVRLCETIATFEFKKYNHDRAVYLVSPESLHSGMILQVLMDNS